MDLTKYKNRKVVLVDEEDCELGETGLVGAHQDPGIKHRAFSLVLYRVGGDEMEVLLQRRAAAKPVFARIWANTCCYNMAPGEEYLERARSRVREEMGIGLGEARLEKLYRFSYYAPDPNRPGWCENEWDQVIVGEWDGEVSPNPEEVEDFCWMEWEKMKGEMGGEPGVWAPWWREMVDDGRLEWRLFRE